MGLNLLGNCYIENKFHPRSPFQTLSSERNLWAHENFVPMMSQIRRSQSLAILEYIKAY